MLMNFSPNVLILPQVYLSQDDIDILVETDRLKQEMNGGNENATICEPELF